MTQDSSSDEAQRLPVTTEMRLSLRQWLAVAGIVVAFAVAAPRLWRHFERFEPGSDYRIPFDLSNDYWLFERRTQRPESVGPTGDEPIYVLGDSVVWGEYVRSDGTLPHFLGQQSPQRAQPVRFINAGVNGLYPLALEGLVAAHGAAHEHRKVIVVCNLLWLSSPKADMQVEQGRSINHASLLPQFSPNIPGYRANVHERLGAVIGRNVEFFVWVDHLQECFFDHQSVPLWTLAEDPVRPHVYPNAYKNPLAQISLSVPLGTGDDMSRGPAQRGHRPWTAQGMHSDRGGRQVEFDWVELDRSQQWSAQRRTIELLRSRGNDVMVVVAPFNEHMVAEASLKAYRSIHSGILAWLAKESIAHVAVDTLPSELYADASHPLTAGYEEMARRIWADDAFRTWVAGKQHL